MDNSTEGVTLLAVFINDVLVEIEKLNIDRKSIQAILEGHDISNPYNHIPMIVYNNLCHWVETNLGENTIIQVGKNIGETVHKALIENGIIQENAKPLDIIEGLVIAAASMIQDNKERGWEIIKSSDKQLIMRRTQTFNSKLQIGLLEGLVSKCPSVSTVNVSYLKEVIKGDDFDEYLVKWENK
ncbi:MAG: hypothetical protein MUE81_20700 [Thermoflexibacter sp.]|jgi:hypothetical protein|nr:hypothetical protein [Thermoflexibacter sp.]